MDMAVFLESLQFMGIGMAGIFVIISILVLLITLFMKLFPPTEDKK